MEQFNPDETPSDTAAGNGPAYTGIPPRNNEAALFVGGLSFSATEEDLRNVRSPPSTISRDHLLRLLVL